MDETTPNQLTELECATVREMESSALSLRAREIFTGLTYFQAIAISAGSHTVRHAIALGQIFEEAFRRFSGEFGKWLTEAVGEDEHGQQRLSEQTARRYRTLWRKRDRIMPADGGVPTCKSITEAYIKCGIIPDPLPGNGSGEKEHLLRLTFAAPSIPIEQWPPAHVRDFLTKAEPIVELYAKVKEFAER